MIVLSSSLLSYGKFIAIFFLVLLSTIIGAFYQLVVFFTDYNLANYILIINLYSFISQSLLVILMFWAACKLQWKVLPFALFAMMTIFFVVSGQHESTNGLMYLYARHVMPDDGCGLWSSSKLSDQPTICFSRDMYDGTVKYLVYDPEGRFGKSPSEQDEAWKKYIKNQKFGELLSQCANSKSIFSQKVYMIDCRYE